MSDYRGLRVVVCGAASGIGAATTELLCGEDAEVHALDVRPVELPVASSHQVDLRNPASIDAAVGRLPDSIDALFNCAGLPQTFGPLDVVAVNILGLRHLTEAVIPKMANSSAIASVASVGGLGWADMLEPVNELLDTADYDEGRSWVEQHLDVVETGYRFSKACVIVYTMRRTHDLLGRGVRINSVSPGDTRTPMTEHFREFYGTEFWESRVLPIGRPAEPHEQARALLFVNSPEASYVAGVNLIVDGGATAARLVGDVPAPAGLRLPGTGVAR